MLGSKFPIFLVFFLLGENLGARTTSSSIPNVDRVSSSGDKELSTHRQYSHQLDSGSSVSYGSNKGVSLASASASAGGGGSGSYGSGEASRGVQFTSGGSGGGNSASSVEYGGVAEGTGSFHSLFPSPSSSSGYPSSNSGGYAPSPSVGGYLTSSSSGSSISGQLPPIDTSAPHGPSSVYYYQHYPQQGVEGHEEGGHGGLFGGDLGGLGAGGGTAGLGGLGGLAGLKGLGILAAAAKGILAIKPFLILGLLFIIAVPILLLFLPIPIITVTGTTGMTPAVGGRSRKEPSVMTYLTQLSERVLTSEECLERFLCKLPKAPEPYGKKAKSLWDTYGLTFIKNQRISRGVAAYFDTAKEKNRVFKCNQRFTCSNKFI